MKQPQGAMAGGKGKGGRPGRKQGTRELVHDQAGGAGSCQTARRAHSGGDDEEGGLNLERCEHRSLPETLTDAQNTLGSPFRSVNPFPTPDDKVASMAAATALVDEILRELITDVAIEEHLLAQQRRARSARCASSSFFPFFFRLVSARTDETNCTEHRLQHRRTDYWRCQMARMVQVPHLVRARRKATVSNA
jgi:hypothetical protein